MQEDKVKKHKINVSILFIDFLFQNYKGSRLALHLQIILFNKILKNYSITILYV